MMLMGWVVMQIAMPNRQGLVGAENLLFDYFPKEKWQNAWSVDEDAILLQHQTNMTVTTRL